MPIVVHPLRRSFLAGMVLACHLASMVGLPSLQPSSVKSNDADRPFPCQDRPCGCLTAEQCWKGDCCCFKLEEKLAWAEANGIDPPGHVRPALEARRAASAPKFPAKSCCKKKPGQGITAACSMPDRQEEPGPAKNADRKRSPVRWVVGMFAQKCRGENSSGLSLFDVPCLPQLDGISIEPAGACGSIAMTSEQVVLMPNPPPIPPPRRL